MRVEIECVLTVNANYVGFIFPKTAWEKMELK